MQLPVWSSWALFSVASVMALVVTDLLGHELKRQLGPQLRPLASRLMVGRRTMTHYRNHRMRYNNVRLGRTPAGASIDGVLLAGGRLSDLSCDCEKPPGAEDD
jgi:hypothetical protein